MNDDNNLDFDRYNHEDYNSNGYRKEMSVISDLNDHENYKHTYTFDGKKVRTHHDRLASSAKVAAIPFLLVFNILLVIFFISPYIGLTKKPEKEAKTCAEKVTKYLGEKYKASFKFTSNVISDSYCDFDVTIDEKTFNLVFTLDAKEEEYFDNYQADIIQNAVKEEFSNKYGLEVVGFSSSINNKYNKDNSYEKYFNKNFTGSNFSEVFNGNTNIKIFVKGDMPKDVSKFATSNKIKNIEITSVSSMDRYNELNLVGDIDLESYYLDKAIVVEDSRASYYDYETVKVNGAYLVFKGSNYGMNMKPTVNSIDDKCSEVVYKGFTGDISGVLKGNIVNLFMNENKKVTINGDNIELEELSSTVYGKTKIGLENGHVKICVG